MADVLRYQMALWLKDIIRRTAADPRASLAKQKAAGEKAVRDDLMRIFMGIPDQQMQQFGDEWQAYNKGQPIGHLFKTKSGAVYGVENDLLDERGANLAAHHQRYRSKTTGRVTRAGTKTRNIGRWKFVDKLHTPLSKLREYIASVQSHVGRTKAGWLPAANYFSAKAKPLVADLAPGWVQRHAAYGAAASPPPTDSLQAHTLTGELVAGNGVPWVRDDSGFMQSTLRTRIRDLENGMWKRLEGIKQKLSINTGAAA
jgi:hypothetical protein